MFRAALRPGVLVVSAVLALTGCSSVVAGQATPAGTPTGPLAQVGTSADLSGVGSPDAYSVQIGPDGAGGVLALSVEPSGGRPTRLVHFTRAGDGFTPDAGRLLPQVIAEDQVLGSRSGRVVVVGQIEGPDRAVYGVLVLDPGKTSGSVIDLQESREADYNVLTPDGKTLYQVLNYSQGGRYPTRVLAVDLDSGAVRTKREVPDLGRAGSLPMAIGLSGDGQTIVVGFQVYDENADHGKEHGAVQRFSTGDLSPRGDPIAVSSPEDKLELESMGVAVDGTVAVLLNRFAKNSRVVVVPAGSTSAKKVYDTEDDIGVVLAVDPAGRWADILNAQDEPESVDLGSGRLADPVALCDGGTEASVDSMLAGHGGTVVVQASCGDKEQLWVVAPKG